MEEKTMYNLAVGAFLVVIAIGVLLYLNPRFFYIKRKEEGFTTAIQSDTFPKCIGRSPDAQKLLAELHPRVANLAPASDAAMAFAEFKLILQKMLCLDADITGQAAGAYTTYSLPFSTMHDIEPTASFVGRCLRNGLRSQDIEIAIDKFETRGSELLKTLCPTPAEYSQFYGLFRRVIEQTAKSLATTCLREHAAMDIPPGVRDPGYYTPPEINRYSDYKETGK